MLYQKIAGTVSLAGALFFVRLQHWKMVLG